MAQTRKERFASAVIQEAGDLAAVAEQITSLWNIYFDSGYNAGGTDPITDPDIASTGLTAAFVTSFMTLAEQLGNFMENRSVAQGDYSATSNKIRVNIL